ncbi:MAG: hypothetical protein QXE98_05680 [Archaeoglobaceae archaeon]
MLLPILEFMVGILYGLSLALYTPSIIKNGLAESYSYLALLSTIVAVLTYYLLGRLHSGYSFAMIIAGISLAIAVVAVENNVVLTAVLLTVFAAINYVSVVYLARGAKDLILSHASHYFGMSLGAMLVYLEIKSPILLLLAFSTLYYQFLEEKREKIESKRSPRLTEIFTVFSIFGLALGLTAMNVEYYVALRFNVEKEVALLITTASLLSSVATLIASPILGKFEAPKLHLIAVFSVATIFASLGFINDLGYAIVLIAISDFAIIFADSTLESFYVTHEQRELAIALMGISWEIFAGIGKTIGFLLYSISYEYPWILSSAILLGYMAFRAEKSSKTLRFWISRDISQLSRSASSS